jgi:uncharacterized protein
MPGDIRSPIDTAHDSRLRTEGHVIECDGRQAVILAEVDPAVPHKENYWSVGQMISILEGRNRVISQCFRIDVPEIGWQDNGPNQVRIHVELIGEISGDSAARETFSTGISNYPRAGASAFRIRGSDLEVIYRAETDDTITVGHLTQEARIPAKLDLQRLLSRHFAIVGSTGVGKSTAVSLMLRKIVANRRDIRVLILDPHNEYTTAFGNDAVVKDASSLQLPFWLFKFAEFTEVIFRSQKGHESEAELLRDMVAEAKERYHNQDIANNQLMRRQAIRQGYTADSPVPYRLIDLFKIIDERLGLLDGKQDKPLLKSVKERLASISRDPRFDFMFGNANSGGDRLQFVISELFRMPLNGRPISIVDMSGLPSEVVSSVVSVLCRMAFDLAIASQGALQTLVVCEEAHRYVPANSENAFWPTRQAIARIAKEGRKYGVYLAVITQRPSELDQTIISQCNTIFSMRLSNIADQKIIGGALTNGAQSAMQFLASIANREAIAFGEGIRTPMRLTFETIAKEMLPGSHIYEMQEAVRNGKQVDINAVIRRMRVGEASIRTGEEPGIGDLGDVSSPREHAAAPGDLADFAEMAHAQPARGEASAAQTGLHPDMAAGRLREAAKPVHSVSAVVPPLAQNAPRVPIGSERPAAGSLISAFRNKV